MNVTVNVDRDEIFETLARTTGYIGSKQIDKDDNAYKRIALTEGDKKMLERFWQESRDRLCLTLRRQICAEGLEANVYRIELNLSSSFDLSLHDTIGTGIANYFVQAMAGKWLALTDRESASEYATAAESTLEYIARKTFCKNKPKRPNISQRS